MGRQYTWRYRCPICGKRYAKKTYWVRHIAGHREVMDRVIPKEAQP